MGKNRFSFQTRGFHLLFSLLPAFLSTKLAFGSTEKLTFYYRFNTSPHIPRINTLNTLYDFQLSNLFYSQVGMRIGEQAKGLGQFNYKAEISTKNLFHCFSFMTRLSKADSFYPTDRYKSIWMNQVRFSYNLTPFTFRINGGTTFTNSVTTGSLLIPKFTGNQKSWTPTFLSEVIFQNTAFKQSYAFRFANYDVFDVYKENSPYFQLSLEQEFKEFRGFIYGRYRFQDKITNFHTFYVGIGVVIPISAFTNRQKI